MLSLTLLSFAAVSLATEVHVLHRVNIFRRQSPTCPNVGEQVCATSATPGGIELECAPVCCYDSSKNFLGGCQANAYCKLTGGSNFICCENGVPESECAAATACVNAGQTAADPTVVCPSSIPICSTTNGNAICTGSFSDLITLTEGATITVTSSPPAVTPSSAAPVPYSSPSSSPSPPPAYGSSSSSSSSVSVYVSPPAPLSTGLGTGVGTGTGTGGPTVIGNGTFTPSAPAATFTGGAAVQGSGVEGAAMGVAMLGSLLALFMA